jgi:hypothetical protein
MDGEGLAPEPEMPPRPTGTRSPRTRSPGGWQFLYNAQDVYQESDVVLWEGQHRPAVIDIIYYHIRQSSDPPGNSTSHQWISA